MGATLIALSGWSELMLEKATLLLRLVLVGGMVFAGATVYFALAIATGAIDKALVKRLLRR